MKRAEDNWYRSNCTSLLWVKHAVQVVQCPCRQGRSVVVYCTPSAKWQICCPSARLRYTAKTRSVVRRKAGFSSPVAKLICLSSSCLNLFTPSSQLSLVHKAFAFPIVRRHEDWFYRVLSLSSLLFSPTLLVIGRWAPLPKGCKLMG